jgi:DNA polymerase-4
MITENPGKEAEFLAPLTVDRLWGVGPKTADRLNNLGIKTIGDLTQIPELELMRLFGKNGHDLWQHAQGIDDSPIITSHEMKSISQEITFARDISDYDELTRMLRRHSERVGERLRKKGLAGTTVKIKLRWPDFTTITRQENLPSPTNADKEIYETALALFKKAWVPGKTVRLIGVGVAGLDKPSQQLKLWDTGEQMASLKRRQLLEAMDELRDRYGRKVIQHLSDLEEEN